MIPMSALRSGAAALCVLHGTRTVAGGGPVLCPEQPLGRRQAAMTTAAYSYGKMCHVSKSVNVVQQW